MSPNAVLLPSPLRNGIPIEIIEEKCTGCNRCVDACRSDVFIPSKRKGRPPLVFYPEECWYCGCCVQECERGALRLVFPLYQRIAVTWKDGVTGEIFYLKK